MVVDEIAMVTVRVIIIERTKPNDITGYLK